MRTASYFVLVIPLLSVWGCGGGEFTSQEGGSGGSSLDAAAGTGGGGGDAGSAGSATGGTAGSVTGGTAGSVTGGTAGSATGGTGGGEPCTIASDCEGPDNECTIKICDNDVCSVSFVDAGAATNSQTGGDCKRFICNGSGLITQEVDDTDVPIDGNPCTRDTCTAGVPSNPNMPSGTDCGYELECNEIGQCSGCTSGAQCGPDGPCFTWSCSSGTCEREDKVPGTACGTCQQCEGSSCVYVQAGQDPNDDCQESPPCGTDGTCNGGGACRFYPLGQPCGSAATCAAGVAIVQDRCDGSGTCVDNGTVTCSPYRCSGPVCGTHCANNFECAFGYVCNTAQECESCFVCSEWYNDPSLTLLRACPSNTLSLIENVSSCACGGMGKCNGDCGGNMSGTGNLCSTVNPGPPDQLCRGCVATNCSAQLEECIADEAEGNSDG